MGRALRLCLTCLHLHPSCLRSTPLPARSRSDPVRLLRTLAFQLGEALPCLRRHLLSLSPREVAGLGGNVEEAFNTLLMEPLSAVQVGGACRDTQAPGRCLNVTTGKL